MISISRYLDIRPVIATLQSTLKLLSDPIRLRLMVLLSLEELSVQELVTITRTSQSRVSNHLSLLKRAGLVQDRREGTWSFHSLVDPESTGPLTPELFDAVLAPARENEEFAADARALEAVREQRRDRSRQTHDRLARAWSSDGQSFTTGALRDQAYSTLVPVGMTIADLGCGTGFLSTFFATRGARVIAVDHAPAMLQAARDSAPEGVDYRQGELDELPIADAEVDATFANLVWHHLADMGRAAEEISRITKPGGRVVITDLLPHDEEWMREELGDHRLGLTPESVMAELAQVGFCELTWEPVKDQYEVEGSKGQRATLPLFLVTGIHVGKQTARRANNKRSTQDRNH